MAAFDQTRFEALVLWIAHETKDDKNFGRTKLAKVLFYSDFDAYRETGSPLTGATYERWQYGPFPKELVEVERGLAASDMVTLDYDVPDGDGKKIRPLVEQPDLSSLFETWQIENVRIYIRQFREQTTKRVSDESHDHLGWRMARELQTIPYEASFLPSGPPRDDQVERGTQIARERGWLTDEAWIWEREST